MGRGTATATWHSDLESLSEPFWLPFRDALRADLHRAMAAVDTSNLGFAQRLEGMDRRQVAVFAQALGPVRVLTVREGRVATILRSPPVRCPEDTPVWQMQLGSFTVHYLTLARNALQDRFALAMEHFSFQHDEFALQLRDVAVGQLMDRESAFAAETVLSLEVTVAMEVLADRVLNGACEEELRVCRMGHAASSHVTRSTFGVAA